MEQQELLPALKGIIAGMKPEDIANSPPYDKIKQLLGYRHTDR